MHMSGMNPYGTSEARMQRGSMNVQPMVQVEPYLYQRLKQMEGMRVVVDTTRGSVNGVLVDAKPDHIAVQEGPGASLFLVRLCEVVWIMPNLD